jgi:hypothetical protein
MINSDLKTFYEVYNKLELDLKNINFQKLSKFKPLRSISGLINENIDSSEGSLFYPAILPKRYLIIIINLNRLKEEK